ncbi:bifunctional phosphopantothenoylcysteine decarboxylase/phosphopantothenate--cysteine ligase CoaBC [Nitrospira sp. KM1]|uniref:bifunctional phosphopantothenoylcysteine decarboxylase/phosphopantothenate--cysteine ligase CoaBC n=1 Tax=Nitrospira sp. KM1 TaxID=1936990 RepID=UPI00156613BF|nr:bifunctional phosphopantothenoylcysteine decarboxylase/phosphopantothenate--cysteine ligase CoaBC [Nitrospira sp. KM1]
MIPKGQGVSLTGKRVVLGVTGSIAAYKAAGLVRAFLRDGATVEVVMTGSATRFVTPLTFEVLSGRPVATDLFEAHQEMKHLTVPEQADVICIAPATANFLAKMALGLGDDLLSTMILTAQCPVVCAPAMDGGMWTHPAVTAHVQTLRARGVVIVDPEEGPLASGRTGAGRLADEASILGAVGSAIFSRKDWSGHRFLISAGPTHEPIDPVRFISNRSSGKMGYALAEAARSRGAQVVLVSGPTALVPPSGVEMIAVESAEQMTNAIIARLAWSSVVIMAAAVADFRPKQAANQKLKKQAQCDTTLDLERTVDILSTVSALRDRQLLVGFAAETQNLIPHAMEKLKSKGLDLIVANDVTAPGAGFGSEQNAATLIDRHGTISELPLKSKRRLADEILDAAARLVPDAVHARATDLGSKMR